MLCSSSGAIAMRMTVWGGKTFQTSTPWNAADDKLKNQLISFHPLRPLVLIMAASLQSYSDPTDKRSDIAMKRLPHWHCGPAPRRMVTADAIVNSVGRRCYQRRATTHKTQLWLLDEVQKSCDLCVACGHCVVKCTLVSCVCSLFSTVK